MELGFPEKIMNKIRIMSTTNGFAAARTRT
jgi:hypothetical protein